MKQYKYIFYTDGSCHNKIGGNRVAACAWVLTSNNNLIMHGVKVLGPGSTNNRAEIQGIIEAIRFINAEGLNPKDCLIITDSQYCQQSFMGELERYAADYERVNNDLWREALAIWPHGVKIIWEKGHSGNRWNDIADELCGQARLNYNQ